MKKMENALNEWLVKVEEQVNQIEAAVATKTCDKDLKQLEQRLIGEMSHRMELGTKQREDDELKEKLFILEKKYVHLSRHIERTGTISVGSRSDILKTENSAVDLDRLNAVEKRIGRKVAETVDSLGAIIKDYAKMQNRLSTRVSDIETKVFGISKPSEPSRTRMSLRDSSARISKRDSQSPPVQEKT
jgi:hypothetical protein